MWKAKRPSETKIMFAGVLMLPWVLSAILISKKGESIGCSILEIIRKKFMRKNHFCLHFFSNVGNLEKHYITIVLL